MFAPTRSRWRKRGRTGGATMEPTRRKFLDLAAGTAAFSVMPRLARAQTYPARPVRLLVGFPPGGVADILARLIGQWLFERLGQPVVVENRPGAATNLATEVVVRAPADGYTLLLISTAGAINTTLYENLKFNFARDIEPVATIMRTPAVMEVPASLPVRTVPEFINYAKANAGKVSLATSGVGAVPHLAGELFKIMAGVDLVEVPYRGTMPALTDLLAGRVQVMFDNVPSSIGQLKAGTLRPLAVTTTARLDVLPEVSPMSDFLPGYEASGWQGIGAPRNVPADIIDTLHREIAAALADPNSKARLLELGGTPLTLSAAEFRRLIADETEKWARVIKSAGIKPE